MDLDAKLARALVRSHPEEAAAVLERGGTESATALLQAERPVAAAEVLRRMAPQFAVSVLQAASAERVAEWLELLPVEASARLLRRLDESIRESLLSAMQTRTADALRPLLQYPEATAGALMDPRVLALPSDLMAGEALTQVRGDPEHALYNLYVVDRSHQLVGVLNLRELMAAPPEVALEKVMKTEVHRLRADLGHVDVLTHPGWQDVHSLPVTDERGVYLGVVRYRTLRRLEEEKRADDALAGSPTARALGDLFRAGAAGLLETVALAAAPRPEPAGEGR